jgi:hypothetical protein
MALKRVFLGAGHRFFRSTILTADVVLDLFAAYQLAFFVLTFSRQMFSARVIFVVSTQLEEQFSSAPYKPSSCLIPDTA